MSTPLPGHLRLAFTTAANKPAIEELFDPRVKQSIDPDAQVAGRSGDIFEQHVANGHGAFLQDEQGTIHTLTMAWHLKENDDAHKRPRHTEIGTALTRLQGFHSASVVIAALTLKEWWSSRSPRGVIAGEVSNSNVPSTKLFRDTLGWKPIKAAGMLADINKLSYAGVINYDHRDDAKTWYQADRQGRQKLARIILDFMDRGTLLNKQGTMITLDLSALEETGLTRPRLEALAGGISTKKALRAIAPGVAPR